MMIRCLVCLIVAVLPTEAASREIKSLPGLSDQPCFKTFTGYLPVGGDASRKKKNLFHWYVEATSEPELKPIVLWLNGGPGCSSLGGMWGELGPYVLDKDLNISLNPYAWNKVANMIFVEQPAGVGFSYPSQATNDIITADDTYIALVAFFAEHPELKGRDFYIAGESYGGHYVPNTAKAIQEGNSAGKNQVINLKGFAVGNGYTDWQLDFNANVENGRFHALTSQSLFEKAHDACDGDFARCFWPRLGVECPYTCSLHLEKATENAMDGSINIYDIYEDVCLDKASGEVVQTQTSMLLAERQRQRERMHAQTETGRKLKGTTISPVFDTCIDNYVVRYLNSPAVLKAIGVNPKNIDGGKWHDCGGVSYDFNYESEIPNYLNWTAEGTLDILIYNGDADYILSHMGNAAWIAALNLTKSVEWTKWRGSDKQVAGYFEEYATGGLGNPFTFLTVKGAGHMVPKDRPRHALDMFTRFISGGDYDKVPPSPTQPLCPKN